MHLALEGGATAFPFVKIAKLMQNGLEAGDSILGLFHAVPKFLEGQGKAT